MNMSAVRSTVIHMTLWMFFQNANDRAIAA
jgi:hypothetical protein